MILLKGDSFVDHGHFILTPSRGGIHADVYAAHLRMHTIPNTKMIRMMCVGDEVGKAYSRLFDAALGYPEKLPYALTLEDDMLPDPDALTRLMATMDEHAQLAGLSALYYTKGEDPRPLIYGHPDVKQDMAPRAMRPGEVIECNGIGMGFALWRLAAFRDMPRPYFVTGRETQDVYFCRRARDLGLRFAVDCSVRVGHLDASTGTVY